jgi:class 3 adenylate cyclase
MSQTHRLAAILAADVAGYSRLMGADEEDTLAALKAIRREIADPKVKEHRGRIVKTTGDGLLIEFASVVDAVRCAVDVQQAMAERNAHLPEARRIEFRMGINLGDIIRDGRDIYGDGVNIAARLETLAEPGAVFVSNTVYEHVRDRLPFAFEDLGEQQVKNIARPVHVYRVRPETASPTAASGLALALPDKPSVAVLPFTNMSAHPEQEFLADGIAEDVITALSGYPSLFVIARNSSFTYKGRPVDVKTVGRELGVRYILEGSLRNPAIASASQHNWSRRRPAGTSGPSATTVISPTSFAAALGQLGPTAEAGKRWRRLSRGRLPCSTCTSVSGRLGFGRKITRTCSKACTRPGCRSNDRNSDNAMRRRSSPCRHFPGDRSGTLAQISPADLDISILGQLTPANLPLGNALEPRPLEVVCLDASFRRGPLGQEPLKDPARHPDHATVFADLDTELHGLVLGIPSSILGEGEEHRRLRRPGASRRVL